MVVALASSFSIFFFNDTATTEIYTLSLHDALPIFLALSLSRSTYGRANRSALLHQIYLGTAPNLLGFTVLSALLSRSEEHTSELQSRLHLVCRLLLEKKSTASVATIPCSPLLQAYT